jgi:hypothetical protein
MASRPDDIPTFPMPDAFDIGLRFLRARRAQNVSWMHLTEQSLRSLADIQQTGGPGGASLARVSTATARFVRDSMEVYKLATAHLAR